MARVLQTNSEARISAIKAGLPYEMFTDLAAELGTSAVALGRIIDISPRTLQRRKAAGTFQADESDRLFRVVRVAERAHEVLGQEGTRWLTSPKRVFGGKTPLEFSDTEAGSWEVMQALGRLEHGVFR